MIEARPKCGAEGMKVRLLFFAGVREALGRSTETVVLPPEVNTVGALREYLAASGEPWSPLRKDIRLRFAVNRSVVSGDKELADGDEVAVFSPVTGG